MADKQALNATFFAFRKRDKAVLLPTTIAFAVLALGTFALFAALNWQASVDYLNWAASMGAASTKPTQGPPSFEAMMPPASVMSLIPAYLLFVLAYYVLLAAYEAACLRWMIRGETAGLFGFSLGADTWRVYFTYWIWLLLLIAFYIVCAITVGGAAVSMIAMSQAGGEPSLSAVLIPLVLGVVILLGLIYFSVRLAPAAATSVARKRFAFFDAWKVSKGRFWGLLGAFLLLFLMYMVLCIALGVAWGVFMGVAVLGQGMQSGDPQSAEEALRAFANPQMLTGVALMYVVLIVAAFTFYVALFGVNARAAQLALEEGKITAGA